VIISLGSSAVMTFRRRVSTAEIGAAREGDEGRHSDASPNSTDSGVLSVVLRPRSVLFFSDEVYSHYMHGIEAVSGRLPPLRAQGEEGGCLSTNGGGADEIEEADLSEWGGVRTSLTIRHLIHRKLPSELPEGVKPKEGEFA
jgi:hypothetical protein